MIGMVSMMRDGGRNEEGENACRETVRHRVLPTQECVRMLVLRQLLLPSPLHWHFAGIDGDVSSPDGGILLLDLELTRQRRICILECDTCAHAATRPRSTPLWSA
jgi:hypothetical protein